MIAMKNEFGQYLRRMRSKANVSLRSAAKSLDISAVYLGEVERGVRPPMKEKHWDKLIKIIEDIDLETLRRLSANTKPLQLDLRDSSPNYQNLGLALARRIEKENIPSKDFDKIFRLLNSSDE